MNTKFKAFVVREAESGVFKSAVEERKVDDLPVGDLLIKVSFSCLLYTSPSPRDQRGSRMPSSA